ncbi:MAG: hypothetical protein FWG77_04675 [Treponema sp.]|nr:hypothetical protein [Treponema sp.]
MSKVTNQKTISLDYIESDDPAEIDRGIRDSIMGVRLSILTMALGLARIKSENLFRKLNYKSMRAYMTSLGEDTKMDHSSIYNWLSIGEAYIKHRNELEMIGFSDKDGPTKLPYLERALTAGKKEEVFSNLINMSKRDFIDFAKSGSTPIPDDAPFLEIRGQTAYINGRRAVIVTKNLNRRYTKLLMATVRVVGRAMKRGGVIVAVHLRNRNEAKRFKIKARRIRANMRKKR